MQVGSVTRRDARDRGAAGVEYAGLITVVVLIVAALVVGVVQSGLPTRVACAVEQVFTQGGRCSSGPPVTYDPSPPTDPGPPVEIVDPGKVDAAVELIRDRLDPGWSGVGLGDLLDIRTALEGLNGAELDAVLAALSDDELRHWVRELEDGFIGGGWSYDQRRDLWSMIAAKAGLETLERLAGITDEIKPDFREVGGDAARDNPDSPANRAEWTDVPHELFAADPDDPDGPRVSPHDLNQGQIGDCWYIATLGALAQQQPGLIEDAITANPNGTYTVRFYDESGKPVYVTVTPDIPGIDGFPVFVSNPSGTDPLELWPHILEKAAAQYYGDYTDIESDWPSKAMQLLTGQRVQTYDGFLFLAPDPPSLGDLAATMEAGGIILLSTDNKDRTSLYTDGTIVQRHAYYVQSVDESAGTVTIVNPWGLEHHPPITMTYEQFRASFIRYDIAQL